MFVAGSVLAATNSVESRGERGRPPMAPDRPSVEQIFARMDANKDGNVTLEEFKAAHAQREQQMREHGVRPPDNRGEGPREGRGDAQQERRRENRPEGREGHGPRDTERK